jgi:hypothetical protein
VTYLTREYGLLEMKSSEGIRRCIHNSLIGHEGRVMELEVCDDLPRKIPLL